MARGIGGGRPYTRGRGGGGYRGGGSSGGYRGRNESRSYEGRNRYDSYDSRPSSKFSSNDRYGARRNDFKRPIPHYRDDSRDRRISPDRKRFRREYPPNQGPRDQANPSYSGRGRDYGGRFGNSNNNPPKRYEQQYDRTSQRRDNNERNFGNRSADRFSDPRRSSSSSRRDDRMPPPRVPAPHRPPPSRGTGRTLALRQAASRIIRRSDLRNPSRRAALVNRTTRDMARRIKLAKIRSTNKRPGAPQKTTKAKAGVDELKKRKLVKATVKKPAAANPKKQPSKVVEKSPKTNGSAKKSDKEETDDELELDASIDNLNGDDTLQDNDEEEEDEDKEEVEENDDDDDEQIEEEKNGEGSSKKFIKLNCPHCNVKCSTFADYTKHLNYNRNHKIAMRRVANKQKTELTRMRTAQRKVQKNLEETATDTLEMRSQFCLLCRLNYRQLKKDHQMSEAHKNMKKFLMPYCSICKINFKSPMSYESHRCSLEHIKKKAYRDSRKSTDEKELDLDNFMTVDEIGDVDLDVANVEFPDDGGDDSETASSTKEKSSSDKDKNTSAGSSRDHKQSKSSTESINVGSEHIKKVEALYCGLCRMYLPRREEKDAATRRHCGTRSHLRLYIRYRDDKQLREEAEKIHRRHQEDREAAKAATTATTTSADGTEVTVKKEKDDAEEGPKKATGDDKEKDNEMDMKMWADVDKDLGDLLREVAPEVADEDEEDSRNNTERYDRFKNSDKVEDDGDKPEQEQAEGSTKVNGSTDPKAAATESSEAVPATE